MNEAVLIAYVFLADLLLGDPRWLPHPVKLIGWQIAFLEEKLRSFISKDKELLSGTLLVIIVLLSSAVTAYMILKIAAYFGLFWEKAAWVIIGYTTLAVNDLYKHGYDVWKSLRDNDLELARKKLSLMVGRDTAILSKEQVVKAAVETVAENTTDGIVSPLFYLFLGGPVLAIVYKAVNTLDSMIAHKDERYLYFGRAAAKLDDLMNYIPARITGLLMVLAAFLIGKDCSNSWKIMLRDGRKHSSPNSGISEAAMAGALGMQFGGVCFYKGERFEYPFIGEQKKKIEIKAIRDALNISVITSLLALLSGMVFV